MVGLVRANSSVGLLRLSGVIKKYRNDTVILMTTITSRFLPEDFTSCTSLIPRPNPNPNIGPIRGDISIAPITTGIEFTLRPTDAMMMAMAKIHALGPRKYMLLRMCFSAASVLIYPLRFIDERNNLPKSLIMAIVVRISSYKYKDISLKMQKKEAE